jgi:hypothetical protein
MNAQTIKNGFPVINRKSLHLLYVYEGLEQGIRIRKIEHAAAAGADEMEVRLNTAVKPFLSVNHAYGLNQPFPAE